MAAPPRRPARPRLLPALADLVLPRACPGCGRPGSLCTRCAAPQVHDVPGGPVRTVAGARYEGALRAALIAYKERGRRELAAPLGALLAGAVGVLGGTDAMLLPVPSTRRARHARGDDHVRQLARRAPLRGRPVAALSFVREVHDSAGLDVAARAANLHAAMRARPPRGRPGPVVVVDDITTTGATLAEAVRACRAAGWQVVGAAVVAATPRRHPRAGAPGSSSERSAGGHLWQASDEGDNV